MAKVSVSIGETFGNQTIPELKKFESLRIDTSIVELDSKEVGVDVSGPEGINQLFDIAKKKLVEQQKSMVETARKYLKERG